MARFFGIIREYGSRYVLRETGYFNMQSSRFFVKIISVTPRQAAVWPYLFVVAGFAVCFQDFPGIWGPDLHAMHTQMLSGQYFDWHPPVLVAFWGLMNTAWNTMTGMTVTGSEVLYVVHAMMLWGGLAFLARSGRGFFVDFIGTSRWRFCLVGILLSVVLVEMVVIIRYPQKDVAMMASYVLAVGILCNFPKRTVWKVLVGACCMLLIFYGTAVRYNAIFSALPLLFLLAAKYRSRPAQLPQFSQSPPPELIQSTRSSRTWPPVVFSLLLWGLLLAGIQGMNDGVLKATKQHSMQEIFYGDIWRLNYATQTFDLPPPVKGVGWAPLTEDVFFRLYRERPYIKQAFQDINDYYLQSDSYPDILSSGQGVAVYHVMYRPDSLGVRYCRDFTGAEDDYRQLVMAWKSKVLKHPLPYMKYKANSFASLLFDFSFMGVNGAWYFAFTAGVFCVWAVRRMKKWALGDITPWCVTLSGLLYVLPYLIFLPDISRRYLYWFYVASLFGAVWFAGAAWMKHAAQRRNSHSESPRERVRPRIA